RYAAFWTSSGGYDAHPLGYGIKAFDMGGHGDVLPVTISNPDQLDLTAYAVGDSGSLLVTLINKEDGPEGRGADVTVVAGDVIGRPRVMFLTAPGGDAAATTGVTLGGAPIADDGAWHGKWTILPATKMGRCVLRVPAASAAILKFLVQ
ncbi:MAG: glycosyl hydrolase family 79 C-terminal domain-containing protein, partial [Limisphaerales bacterium]